MQGGPEKVRHQVVVVTASNGDQFANFFHFYGHQKICDKATMKDCITLQNALLQYLCKVMSSF